MIGPDATQHSTVSNDQQHCHILENIVRKLASMKRTHTPVGTTSVSLLLTRFHSMGLL